MELTDFRWVNLHIRESSESSGDSVDYCNQEKLFALKRGHETLTSMFACTFLKEDSSFDDPLTGRFCKLDVTQPIMAIIQVLDSHAVSVNHQQPLSLDDSASRSASSLISLFRIRKLINKINY